MISHMATTLSSIHKHSKAASMLDKNGKKDFEWTNDETELLLNCTHLCKVQKLMLSDDW